MPLPKCLALFGASSQNRPLPPIPISVIQEGSHGIYWGASCQRRTLKVEKLKEWVIVRVIWPTPLLSNTSRCLSFVGCRLTQMCTWSLRIRERFCLFDLGCRCKDLLINNYKALDNSKCPTDISHPSNLYFEILLGAFNNYLLRSTHPHLLLPRHPAVQTDPTVRTSLKPPLRLSFPSTLQSFVLSSSVPFSATSEELFIH